MSRRMLAPLAALAALLIAVAPVSAAPFPARVDLPDGWAVFSGTWKIVRRRGVVFVVCNNPRHKQRQG